MLNKPDHLTQECTTDCSNDAVWFTGEVLATNPSSPSYVNIKHDTRTCSDLQAEKPASNALNIATISNLKFLKLFPGPVS